MSSMNGTRVLHLIDSAGMYGAERVVIALLEELKRSSFSGVLGCIREDSSEVPAIAKEAMKRNLPVEFFTMRRGLNVLGALRVLRYARSNEIGVIHTHGYKPNMLCAVVPRGGIKVVSTVHGWAKQTAGARGRLYEGLDALSLRRMDRLVAVSEAVRDDLVKRHISRGVVAVIYNGLSLESYDIGSAGPSVRNEYGLAEDAFVIGAVGRLATVKGFEYLIDAIASLTGDIPTCRLIIAGEGPLKEHLARRIAAHRLKGIVKLIGFEGSIVRLLSAIDLFVMPSLSEGLPMALLEAMACRRPVIASAVGGVPEVIVDGENGVLCGPADPQALADCIRHMFSDKARRDRMSVQGKQVVERTFSARAMGNQYKKLYGELLGQAA